MVHSPSPLMAIHRALRVEMAEELSAAERVVEEKEQGETEAWVSAQELVEAAVAEQ